ncbi:MAG TPA: sigma-70 family RNA polymerase sigma factor [Bryobacteraceae bacterium]|nr:sigma-70 family RNA polymerase sigma factor [Bryobacteraceae bacterium]
MQAAVALHAGELVTAPLPPEASRDTAVVDAARQGDHQAFSHLYDDYARMVHGILMARVPRDEVDDLVQDVFFAAFRKLRTLRDSAAFPGWLAMIARNRAADYHRRAPEIAELPEDLPASNVNDAEAAAILAVVRTLPEAYRETLVLRLVEGMTGPEIARRTGLTAASVRVNLHRGLKQLREKLGGRHA